ncbi:hypothetical protein PLICRDRAFT_172667 [Plicaturopsis crispa FD-325 SS-3]|nr:hypothetical protein PLICRDRAFT_172667 [Plicaturopsis crispa FD-325 SS-3]
MSPHQFKPLFARAWRIGPPVLLPRENSGLESQSQAQNVSINDAYHANELVRCLVKTFEFEKFATAWKFVEGLRDLTQLTRHHPMITIDSRKVHIYLHTHDARSGTSIGPGVTMRDVDFAALLEESLSTLSTTDVHPGITTAEDTAKLLARTKDMKAEAKAAKLRH